MSMSIWSLGGAPLSTRGGTITNIKGQLSERDRRLFSCAMSCQTKKPCNEKKKKPMQSTQGSGFLFMVILNRSNCIYGFFHKNNLQTHRFINSQFSEKLSEWSDSYICKKVSDFFGFKLKKTRFLI